MKKPMNDTPELTPARLARMYCSWIEGITDERNWENDTLQAVITRSLVEDFWSQLTPQEQAMVQAADDQLAAHWQQVAELWLNPKDYPRTHWWWYLHEGPQVRAEAQKVTLRP
jgi:hypothetical protein